MDSNQINISQIASLRPMMPNFFVLGAAKAGTTSLHYYLNQHPSIYVPVIKEPHFFDSDKYYQGIQFYVENYFKSADKYDIRGDLTPALHKADITAPRVKHEYGDLPLKFIIVLRDPVERAWSHYQHAVRNMRETENFLDALELEPTRLTDDRWQWLGYYRDGLYSTYIQRWYQYYPREQFLFLLTEELKTNLPSCMKQICEFLNVDSNIEFELGKKRNVASVPRNKSLMRFMRGRGSKWIGYLQLSRFISSSTRRQIRNFFFEMNLKTSEMPVMIDPETEKILRLRYQPSIEELQLLIDLDIAHWLPKTE